MRALRRTSSLKHLEGRAFLRDNGVEGKDSKRRLIMDWTGCDLIEQIPGKVSGLPLVKGTRVLADTIVEEAELGESVEDIHENYPSVAKETIRKILAFAKAPTPQSHH